MTKKPTKSPPGTPNRAAWPPLTPTGEPWPRAPTGELLWFRAPSGELFEPPHNHPPGFDADTADLVGAKRSEWVIPPKFPTYFNQPRFDPWAVERKKIEARRRHAAGGRNKPPVTWYERVCKRGDEIHRLHPTFSTAHIAGMIRDEGIVHKSQDRIARVLQKHFKAPST